MMKSSVGSTPQSTRAFSVLLVTNHLIGWTGSETLLLTLVAELRAHGHLLAIYARHIDWEWISCQIDAEVSISDDLTNMVGLTFDLAHVQHSSCLIDVRAHFPQLPILFSSLGVLPFLEHPPPFDCGVSRYLAISEEVAHNLEHCGVPQKRIEIFRNLVSGHRFHPIDVIRPKPERILVLSYKMDEGRKDLLREVAARIGASIRFAGDGDSALSQEQLVGAINDADVVVSLGRGVIETMLCGRIPLVFDIHGGDGLVTPDTLAEVRSHNFSGRRYRIAFTVPGLIEELAKYRQEYGSGLRELALEQFSVENNLPLLLETYDKITTGVVMAKIPVQSRKLVEFCYGLGSEDAKIRKSFEKQLAAMNANLQANLHAEIDRIKGSLSWQVTKPLRLIAFIWRVFKAKFHKE